jgi:hypothetical protein
MSKGKGKGRSANKGAVSGGATNKGGGKGSTSTSLCACCGKEGHLKRECYHVKKECNTCSRVGHLAHMCRATVPPPSQEPREHVPGMPRKSYAEAARMTSWPCPTCHEWVKGELNACQQVNCKGKRLLPKTTGEVKENSFLPKNFQRLGPATATTDEDAEMQDEEQQEKEEKARTFVALCKEMGNASMIEHAEKTLRELMKTRTVAKEADPRTALTCASALFKMQNLHKQWAVENDKSMADEIAKMCNFEKNTALHREKEIARHKREMEAIDAESLVKLAAFKQATEAREQRYQQNLAQGKLDLDKIAAAQQDGSNRETRVAAAPEFPASPQEEKGAPEMDLLSMSRQRRDAMQEELKIICAKEDEEVVRKETERLQAEEVAAEKLRLQTEADRMQVEDAAKRERQGINEASIDKKQKK